MHGRKASSPKYKYIIELPNGAEFCFVPTLYKSFLSWRTVYQLSLAGLLLQIRVLLLGYSMSIVSIVFLEHPDSF